MKNFLGGIVFLSLFVVLFQGCKECKKCDNKGCSVPIGWGDLLLDTAQKIFVKNQLIVIYKDKPTAATKSILKNRYQAKGIDTTKLNIHTCSSCDDYVELWNGEGIHTVINGPAGGSLGTRGASDDTLAHYSLNFISKLPDFKPGDFRITGQRTGTGDTIRVAVLDTGFDTLHLGEEKSLYLWKSGPEFPKGSGTNCYQDATYGWNFVNNSSNINDDNPGLHGTLLTQYILNEMFVSQKNIVQIMSLKTHDSHGIGNLFDIICALHYAVKNKAQVINASWGFYYFDAIPHPYLSSYISDSLPDNGIVFVTAAGNQSDDTDADALKAGYSKDQLRNLDIHKFYPACLSSACNSVITATTTDGMHISRLQNYSGNYVDLGVMADTINMNDMYFNWPFLPQKAILNGSSFATAITTGIIAANISKSTFKQGVSKQDIIQQLNSEKNFLNEPIIYYSDSLKFNNLVRYGKYVKHGANPIQLQNPKVENGTAAR